MNLHKPTIIFLKKFFKNKFNLNIRNEIEIVITSLGDTVAIITVLQFPPNESFVIVLFEKKINFNFIENNRV